MLIADTHSDTLFAMGVSGEKHPTITPERLRQGGVSLQVFALWTGPDGKDGDVDGILKKELSAVPAMEAAGLRKVDDPLDVREGEHCFMLSIEGGEPLCKGISSVEEWREKGVRMVALTWNHENAIGYPAKNDCGKGLTPYGIQVVKEMQRLGMAVDTSHLNEAGFYDLFAKTDKPPMASHSCCRALCDHCRNLTDDQLRLMIREGGYVGVNFYPWFLSKTGKADIARIVEHIDHICQMGGAANVGFGSDFDGIEVSPDDLQDPSQLPLLLDAMWKRGYSEEAIAGIAGQNLLNYYRRIG